MGRKKIIVELICLQCRKIFIPKCRPGRALLRKFCSKRCKDINMSGVNAPNYIDGISHVGNGYRTTLVPGHPRAIGSNHVKNATLVMEKFLGRYLLPGELVHHIDGNETNDDLSNLKLMSS